jgi:hypothetical protein
MSQTLDSLDAGASLVGSSLAGNLVVIQPLLVSDCTGHWADLKIRYRIVDS